MQIVPVACVTAGFRIASSLVHIDTDIIPLRPRLYLGPEFDHKYAPFETLCHIRQ
jgi:hypothetical protein